MLITQGGFSDRTRVLLRRFDDWFTIDDIIAKKLGIVPKPFNMFSDDIELIDINAKNDKTGTYTTSNTPKVGDIIIWQRSTQNWKGHAGVVTAVKDGMVETIEGNTDSVDLSNGQYVAKKNQISKVGNKMPDSTVVVRGYIRKLDEA